MSVLKPVDNPDVLIEFIVTVDEDFEGSWADFATYHMGAIATGSADLDDAIAELYSANEKVHKIANQLRLRYEVPF